MDEFSKRSLPTSPRTRLSDRLGKLGGRRGSRTKRFSPGQSAALLSTCGIRDGAGTSFLPPRLAAMPVLGGINGWTGGGGARSRLWSSRKGHASVTVLICEQAGVPVGHEDIRFSAWAPGYSGRRWGCPFRGWIWPEPLDRLRVRPGAERKVPAAPRRRPRPSRAEARPGGGIVLARTRLT